MKHKIIKYTISNIIAGIPVCMFAFILEPIFRSAKMLPLDISSTQGILVIITFSVICLYSMILADCFRKWYEKNYQKYPKQI